MELLVRKEASHSRSANRAGAFNHLAARGGFSDRSTLDVTLLATFYTVTIEIHFVSPFLVMKGLLPLFYYLCQDFRENIRLKQAF